MILSVENALTHPSLQDFGFLFDSSPGGNAKFERAPFKLSAEMLRLLGKTFEIPIERGLIN